MSIIYFQDEKSLTGSEVFEKQSDTNSGHKEKSFQVGSTPGSRSCLFKSMTEKDLYEIVKTPLQLETFRPYMEYVDNIIASEIMEAIKLSIKYLKFEMEDRLQHNAPLFDVKLALQIPNIVFLPSLDLRSKHVGFMTELELMIMNIYNMSDMIVMVAQPPENERIDEDGNIYEATFELFLEDNKEIEHMKMDIISLARQTIREAVAFANEFEKYSFIWTSDKKLYLDQFLKYGRALTSEEVEELNNDTLQVIIFKI